MLNEDGTKVIDESTGEYVPTYTNADIVNFSRGWTNFVHRQDQRDNIEAEWDLGWIPNTLEPMELPTSEGRDVFPKLQLKVNGDRGYIGDKIARCDALPSKAWLKKGASYHFRENSQSGKSLRSILVPYNVRLKLNIQCLLCFCVRYSNGQERS